VNDRSKVTKHAGSHWEGVSERAYKDESAHHRGVTRHELMGAADDESALGVIVRYFEVAPGGYSSLERHEHAHAVVVIRGTGTVVLGEQLLAVAPFDCVYVAPNTLHQFQASAAEALGFLCIVDRVRDRPILPSPAELAALASRGVSFKPR
jgi:quercetin dioxygenase-like cupin family protein